MLRFAHRVAEKFSIWRRVGVILTLALFLGLTLAQEQRVLAPAATAMSDAATSTPAGVW